MLARNPVTRPVAIGPVTLGGGGPPAVIAGPCVIEDEETPLRIARRLKEIAAEVGLPIIFKASYDKANRTSVLSFRGIGVEEGLAVLARAKEETGLPLLSDDRQVPENKGTFRGRRRVRQNSIQRQGHPPRLPVGQRQPRPVPPFLGFVRNLRVTNHDRIFFKSASKLEFRRFSSGTSPITAFDIPPLERLRIIEIKDETVEP